MFSNPEKWPNICLHRSCHSSTSYFLHHPLKHINNIWDIYSVRILQFSQFNLTFLRSKFNRRFSTLWLHKYNRSKYYYRNTYDENLGWYGSLLFFLLFLTTCSPKSPYKIWVKCWLFHLLIVTIWSLQLMVESCWVRRSFCSAVEYRVPCPALPWGTISYIILYIILLY